VAPDRYPIPVEWARAQCRLSHFDEDDHLDRLIGSVAHEFESTTGIQCLNATWTWTLDEFPDGDFELPVYPLSSVTSIQYIDTAGATQTLAASVYDSDANANPPRIALAYNQSWPTTRGDINAVTVTYVAGYGTDAASVPDTIRQALLMRVADLFENRGDAETRAAANARDAGSRLFWASRVAVV
jgi:uncharacterized phiE125 gp8 family phage protein